MFSAATVEIADTQKVPGLVKVWILKLPQFVIVPPVADIKLLPVTELDVSCTLIQPSVPSTYINVADCPSVDRVAFAATPPIFSEPFGDTVKLFV